MQKAPVGEDVNLSGPACWAWGDPDNLQAPKKSRGGQQNAPPCHPPQRTPHLWVDINSEELE